MGRGQPRYHPAWLHAALSVQQLPQEVIGCAYNAARAEQTTNKLYSLAQLRRELLPGSHGRGFQSRPLLPCRFTPEYFPSSSRWFSPIMPYLAWMSRISCFPVQTGAR